LALQPVGHTAPIFGCGCGCGSSSGSALAAVASSKAMTINMWC
jgi:hypothetical protein